MNKAFLGLLAITVLPGCSIGPDYLRPETAAPAGWQAAAAVTETWPSADWWRGFTSPPLDDFMAQAGMANLDIAAAIARVRQADAQVKIAGAALLPSLQATVGDTRTRGPTTVPKSGGSPRGQNTGSGLFIASYEFDFWGKHADAVEAAQALAQATRFDRQTTALTIQSTVAATYFAICAFQDRIRVADSNLAIAEHTLDAIQARAAAGTAAALDVAQQESVVAEQRAAIPPLRQQLRPERHCPGHPRR